MVGGEVIPGTKSVQPFAATWQTPNSGGAVRRQGQGRAQQWDIRAVAQARMQLRRTRAPGRGGHSHPAPDLPAQRTAPVARRDESKSTTTGSTPKPVTTTQNPHSHPKPAVVPGTNTFSACRRDRRIECTDMVDGVGFWI